MKMQQHFLGLRHLEARFHKKVGSPWHLYQRVLDHVGEGDHYYSDDPFYTFKSTPGNFPWLHDQDASHHYRNGNLQNPFMSSIPMNWLPGRAQPQPNITEKIYLDSPVAPAGWQEVGSVAPVITLYSNDNH